MQRTALCALDPELASKLGLRSFHGMRELIQGNSTGETIDRSLLNPLKKRGASESHLLAPCLHDTSENVPWGNLNKALYLQIQVYAHMYR